MDGPGGFESHVTGNAPRERKLLEELFHPFSILGDVGIHLAVGTLQIGIGHQTWTAMPGTGIIHHIEIMLLNEPIQLNVEKV